MDWAYDEVPCLLSTFEETHLEREWRVEELSFDQTLCQRQLPKTNPKLQNQFEMFEVKVVSTVPPHTLCFDSSKAMKSSPLLGPFRGSEFWVFSVENIARLGVLSFYVSNFRQQSAVH